MNEDRITESLSWSHPRGQAMKTPDDVADMLRLKGCGCGLKRIGRHLGCSHHTVKVYVAAGGVKPFRAPERRKRLDGLEDWLRERFIRHRGNADVVRQDLLAEQGLAVSPRTLQRAVRKSGLIRPPAGEGLRSAPPPSGPSPAKSTFNHEPKGGQFFMTQRDNSGWRLTSKHYSRSISMPKS
jgi:hypothetical protein